MLAPCPAYLHGVTLVNCHACGKTDAVVPYIDELRRLLADCDEHSLRVNAVWDGSLWSVVDLDSPTPIE